MTWLASCSSRPTYSSPTVARWIRGSNMHRLRIILGMITSLPAVIVIMLLTLPNRWRKK